jgi:CheY-like chemotaxis protein
MPFRTILAADDSSGVLESLTSLFGPPSYRVVKAPNGKGALSLARAVRPDLVITDMILPTVANLSPPATSLRISMDSSRAPASCVAVVLVEGCAP